MTSSRTESNFEQPSFNYNICSMLPMSGISVVWVYQVQCVCPGCSFSDATLRSSLLQDVNCRSSSRGDRLARCHASSVLRSGLVSAPLLAPQGTRWVDSGQLDIALFYGPPCRLPGTSGDSVSGQLDIALQLMQSVTKTKCDALDGVIIHRQEVVWVVLKPGILHWGVEAWRTYGDYESAWLCTVHCGRLSCTLYWSSVFSYRVFH